MTTTTTTADFSAALTRRGFRLVAVACAALSAVSAPAQVRAVKLDPAELARLRTQSVSQLETADVWPVQNREIERELTLVRDPAFGGETGGRDGIVDLYVGLQTQNNFWRWVSGGQPTAYWALDDGRMGPGAAAVGGGHVTEYEFSVGAFARFPGDQVRPFVIVSFYNAPYDPVAQATDPVVDPPTPVSSIAWDMGVITLPSTGPWFLRSGLLDLISRGDDFDLDETYYVEIQPLEWSTIPNGSPRIDPDVYELFTGSGTVTYGTNQNRMWSDWWVRRSVCNSLVTGDGDGLYDHPTELDQCGTSLPNQAGIILRGLPCGGPTLQLRLDDPEAVLFRPGEIVTLTMSQSCLPGLVAQYEAFLVFDPHGLSLDPNASGYLTPQPYGVPIMTPIAATDGELALAAAIDAAGGQNPTSSSADLVTLAFTAGASDGLYSVSFVADRDSPTRLFDPNGQPIALTALVGAPPICVDGTGPVIDAPADLSDVQCPGQVPAPAADYAGFVAQGGYSEDGGCGGPAVTIVHVGDSTNGGTGCATDPLIITRTYRATDVAGNETLAAQTFTVADTSAPTFAAPADITHYADGGGATLTLTAEALGWPTDLEDNCADTEYLAGHLTWVRSDLQTTLTAPFDVGVTTVTWTVTDQCGNSTDRVQTITVGDGNILLATLELRGVTANTIDRCLSFELEPGHATLEQVVTFTDGRATDVPVVVPCGAYDCIRARDPLHSVWAGGDPSELGALVIEGGRHYVANFTDDSTFDNRLVLGNLNQDPWIDVDDFAVFAGHYGDTSDPNLACSAAEPQADFDGNGLVDTADFVFIQTYLLAADDTGCGAKLGAAGDEAQDAEAPDATRHAVNPLASAELNRGDESRINLQLRPVWRTVSVGEPVQIGLYAVCEADETQVLRAADVVLSWDPALLELLGNDDSGGVPLLSSSLPVDDPYGLNGPATPPSDGTGYYRAWANLGDPVLVTDAGVQLTTFQFTALTATAAATVTIELAGGNPPMNSRVFGGTEAGVIVTGTLNSASVVVQTCYTDDPDGDSDVDLADFAAFQGCFTAAGGTATEECRCVFDLDGDEDIDGADFESFAAQMADPR